MTLFPKYLLFIKHKRVSSISTNNMTKISTSLLLTRIWSKEIEAMIFFSRGSLIFSSKSFIFLFRNDFSGQMTAYGAGNDDTLNTYKAGPGTIYIKEGNKQYLTISGDTDSSIQNQTKTDITGGDNEFTYNQLTLNGNAQDTENIMNTLDGFSLK